MLRVALAVAVLGLAVAVPMGPAEAQEPATPATPWLKSCDYRPDHCTMTAFAMLDGWPVAYLFVDTIRTTNGGPIHYLWVVPGGDTEMVVRAGDGTLLDGREGCEEANGRCGLVAKLNDPEFERVLEAGALTVEDSFVTASISLDRFRSVLEGEPTSFDDPGFDIADSAVVAEARDNLPALALTNHDPDALPVGIRFHSSLATEFRRLIIEDLQYLWDLGALEDSDLLAAMLGQPAGTLTGRDVATWLIQSMPVVSGTDYCHGGSLFRAEAEGTLRPFRAREVEECAGRESYAALTYIYPPYFRGATILVNDEFSEVPEGQKGFRILSLVAMPTGEGPASRIGRIEVLVHEAFHSRNNAPHVACAEEERLIFADKVTLGGYEFDPAEECDSAEDGYFSAYAAGAEAIRVLTLHCEECDDAARMELGFTQMSVWGVTGLATRPFTIPDEGVLKDSGLTGRSIAVVPPFRFFEAARAAMSAGLRGCGYVCGAGWRDDLEDAVKAIDALEEHLRGEDGLLPEAWAKPALAEPIEAPVLDHEGAARWLAAASAAKENGYNVPLAFQIPCQELGVECARILAAYRGVAVEGLAPGWTQDPLIEELSREGRVELGIAPGRGSFSSEDADILDRLAAGLLINSDWRIVVEGHTDARGNPADNRAAGRAQAEAVRGYLIDRGIDPARIRAMGVSSPARAAGDPAEVASRRFDIRLDFGGLDLAGLTPRAGAVKR